MFYLYTCFLLQHSILLIDTLMVGPILHLTNIMGLRKEEGYGW